MWIETHQSDWASACKRNSFASNGECGLKRQNTYRATSVGHEFIRQQWRMWIETTLDQDTALQLDEFIRQQWRMWIETDTLPAISPDKP